MERSPKGALERLRRDLRLMEGELGVDVSAVLKHLHLALEEFDNHPMRCVRCFGRGTIKCLMCGGTGELQLAPARGAAGAGPQRGGLRPLHQHVHLHAVRRQDGGGLQRVLRLRALLSPRGRGGRARGDSHGRSRGSERRRRGRPRTEGGGKVRLCIWGIHMRRQTMSSKSTLGAIVR